MQQRTDALLDVKNLTVEFHLFEGVIRAVDSVSLQIMPQQTLGVIGESGSGKSVTAQAILGLVPSPPGKIVSGEIMFQRNNDAGRMVITDLARLNPTGPEIRSIRGREISMIFQEPMNSFGPLNSVGDQIMEAILIHEHGMQVKDARQRAIDLLRLVGIPQSATAVDAYPHQLSGGMRQRAMIAMAIALNPALLLADEPTTALDVTVQAQILALLTRLRREHGMAMMYITHNLAVVAEIADHVAVMYLGRIMEYCSVEEITGNPLHPYTRALQASIPRIDGDIQMLQPIRGTLPSPYRVPVGCVFSTRCDRVMPGVCDVAPPPAYKEASPGHWVSCHLYN